MSESVSDHSPTAPAVIVPAHAGSSRGAETLIRVAVCAASALVVSLGWIVVGDADLDVKTFSLVTGLTGLAIMVLIVGYTRAEVNKVRYDLAATEARLLAAIETTYAEIRSELAQAADATSASGNGRRPARVRRGLRRRDSLQPEIPDELRIFLQGRESAYEEDDGGDGFRV